MTAPSVAQSGAALDELATLLGRPVEISHRRDSPYRSTHPLEEIVAFAGDARLELVLKGSGGSGHRVVRPRLVRDARREAWAYGSLLDRKTLDTPRFYGVLRIGPNDERLVVERVSGRPLTDVGDPEAWRAAAHWLGVFHAWGRSRVLEADASCRLLRQTRALHERWWRRAVRIAHATGQHGDLARLRDIKPVYTRAVNHLARSTPTTLHGEFYPSNVMVEAAGRGWRTRPVDWESVSVGSALLDLAALVTGDWTDAERDDLCGAWAEGAGTVELVAMQERLAAAQLVNAMQWLGWSTWWSPPAHHARDWLIEASNAADRFADLEDPRP